MPIRVPAARVVFSEADRAEIAALVDEALRSGALTLGPRTDELEHAFAARHDVPYAARLLIKATTRRYGGREGASV